MGELYNETPSIIKEKILYNQLEGLLTQFLGLLEAETDNNELVQLIKTILSRYEYIFVEKELKIKIKKLLKDFMERILSKYPYFIILLEEEFVSYLNYYNNEECEDLVRS